MVSSSPLIILSRAGVLEFLRLVGDRILVPSAVAREIAVYGPGDPTSQAIAETEWLVVVEVDPQPSILNWGLGGGESATLAWAAAHPGTTVILDDGDARRAADSLRIPVIGTLGLILAAKEYGLITEAAPVIYAARRAGLYVSDRLVRASLARVGE